MSDDGLQLSDDLVHGMMNLVMNHDPATQQDMIRALQYLSAVTGYLVADYPGPVEERDALLDHLAEFAKHVADDEAESRGSAEQAQEEPQAAPAGRIEQGNNPAMGVWKPE